MRRRIFSATTFAVLISACGGSTSAPGEEGVGVFPLGRYALLDSVSNDRKSGASGELTIAKDSSYLWTMGSTRRAGYLHGPVTEVIFIDTTSRGFAGVWLATATSSRLTIRTLNESVIYHFRTK